MTTCKPAPRNTAPAKRQPLRPKPEGRPSEADKERAFDAGVRWFLAVSRAA